MRVIVAPQEFKGTLTAKAAAEAMAVGVRRALPDAQIDVLPLSDGGPGLMEAMVTAVGGEVRRAPAHDPLGRPIEALWGILADGVAVVEVAQAAGLGLLEPQERDPRRTSTFGVGELIRAALGAATRRLIIGLGGSATNDGGAGMASALGARFLDAHGAELPPGGASLIRLERIDVRNLDPRLRNVATTAAADVRNPLCGSEGASLVYGPQKGASLAVAQELDAALRRYAEVIQRDLDVSVMDVPGAGAAGGLGAGLIAFLGAEIRPGFEVAAETVGLRNRLTQADLVVTGEGRLDGQTAYGKTVAGVAEAAAKAGVPVLVTPGCLGPGWESILPMVYGVEPIVGAAATAEDAESRPAGLLALTVERALLDWRHMEQMRRGG